MWSWAKERYVEEENYGFDVNMRRRKNVGKYKS